MHDRAWKKFLTSTPVLAIGIVFGIALIASSIPTFISGFHSMEVKAKQEFAKECTLLNGYVSKIADVTFCVDVQAVPDVVWTGKNNEENYRVTNACIAAGGRIIDLSPTFNDKGCYTYTILEELGARHDYVLSN